MPEKHTRKRGPVPSVPTCHPDRPYKAKGLCAPCYNKGNGKPATCHPERLLMAKGLCGECYTKQARPAECHPDRRVHGHGLCMQCYLERPRPAKCHPGRQTHGLGLCHACYLAKRDLNPSDCHPERPAQGHGLCKPCYTVSYCQLPHVWEQRKRDSWKTHGLDFTVGQYFDLLKKQGGGCAICDARHREERWLAVDHDHATGTIRGLLCNYCNRRLIAPRNTVEILQRAVAYLEAACLAPAVSQPTQAPAQRSVSRNTSRS